MIQAMVLTPPRKKAESHTKVWSRQGRQRGSKLSSLGHHTPRQQNWNPQTHRKESWGPELITKDLICFAINLSLDDWFLVFFGFFPPFLPPSLLQLLS